MISFRTKEKQTQVDLEWLFNESSSACGIKSNFSAMVNAAIFGGATTFHDPYNDSITESIHLKRQLEKIYSILTNQHQNILFASFGHYMFPGHVTKIFKHLSGAAFVVSRLDLPDFLKLCHKFHLGTLSVQDKLKITEIRIDAQSKYQDAILQYHYAKKKIGLS